MARVPSARNAEYVEYSVRLAVPSDFGMAAQMLHDFNTEYGDQTPGPERLSERISRLVAGGDTSLLVAAAGDRGLGVSLLRFRESLWGDGLECCLAELYVVPDMRGLGIGRRLLEASIDYAKERGAIYMDLGTSEDDEVAMRLYESCGFTNRERLPDGPVMFVYERDL